MLIDETIIDLSVEVKTKNGVHKLTAATPTSKELLDISVAIKKRIEKYKKESDDETPVPISFVHAITLSSIYKKPEDWFHENLTDATIIKISEFVDETLRATEKKSDA